MSQFLKIHEHTQIVLESGKAQLYVNFLKFPFSKCLIFPPKSGTGIDTHRILHIVHP